MCVSVCVCVCECVCVCHCLAYIAPDELLNPKKKIFEQVQVLGIYCLLSVYHSLSPLSSLLY